MSAIAACLAESGPSAVHQICLQKQEAMTVLEKSVGSRTAEIADL
jgi:hypothetical protein